MAGLYDAVKAENSQYVPQFVGSTYKELSEAGKVLDERFRENKATSDKIAMMMANEQFLEKDKDLKEGMMKSIYGSIEGIAKSDENFENSSAAVSQIARDYFTNQNRIAASENFKLAEQDKELERTGHNLNFGDNRESFSTIDPATGQPRRFNVQRQKQLDYDKKMQDLLGRVAVDGGFTTPTGDVIKFDDQERNLIKSGQWQGVSAKKLDKLVESLIPAYKQSQEGQQDFMKMTKLDGLKGEVFDVKEGNRIRQTTDIDENIRQRFQALARPQAGMVSRQEWQDYGETSAKQAEKTYQEFMTGTNPGAVQGNSVFNPITADAKDGYTWAAETGPQKGKFIQFRDKATGEIVPLDKLPKGASGGSGMGGGDAALWNKYEQVEVDPKVVKAEKMKLFEKSTRAGAKFKDEAHFDASLAAANKSHKQVTARGMAVGAEQRKNYDDQINAGIGRSPMTVPNTGEVLNLDKLAKMAGVDKSKIKLETDQVFFDSPNKNMPPGYVQAKVIVEGEAGNDDYPSVVQIPVNEQFSGIASDIDHLLKNSYYQGKDTYDNPSKAYFPKQLNASNRGEQLGFYTETVLLPIEEQQAGQSAYRTIVKPIIRKRNSYGGYDTENMTDVDAYGNEVPKTMTVEEWQAEMGRMLSPKLMRVLNSGQKLTEKDAKTRGIK
jgi:hypothetical protein